MAQTIKIKRSSSSAAPSSLGAGELAYSSNSKKLFVGHPSSAAVTTIGGDLYVAMLDHSAGTLTASSAILVGSDSKIDQLKTGSTVITGANNTIATAASALTLKTTTSGNIAITSAGALGLNAAGTVTVTHGGTLSLASQSNSITILDDNAAALDINEGGTSYIKLITTNGSEEIELGKNVDLNGTLDVSSSATVNSLSSNGAITASGNLVINTDKFTDKSQRTILF